MPYVYSEVDDLDGIEKVGSKQCVALLQHYVNLRQTALWKEGKSVMGEISIVKGTAIATFVGGKYQSLSTGNHAAFYISQDSSGIWVLDQWKSDKEKPRVSIHHIKKKGKFASGTFIDPSKNADAYSVVE